MNENQEQCRIRLALFDYSGYDGMPLFCDRPTGHPGKHSATVVDCESMTEGRTRLGLVDAVVTWPRVRA